MKGRYKSPTVLLIYTVEQKQQMQNNNVTLTTANRSKPRNISNLATRMRKEFRANN